MAHPRPLHYTSTNTNGLLQVQNNLNMASGHTIVITNQNSPQLLLNGPCLFTTQWGNGNIPK